MREIFCEKLWFLPRQIYQRTAERHQTGLREELLGPSSGPQTSSYGAGTNLDKILAEHKDQQERVAEEMIALTRSLKETSSAAGAMIRKDTSRLDQAVLQADRLVSTAAARWRCQISYLQSAYLAKYALSPGSNLTKLEEETKRVGEFSARGSCRCWIWLMMVLVLLTFMAMVLTMRLFRKGLPAPVYEAVTKPPPSSFKAEL